MTVWTKLEEPVIPLPPRGGLAGFRDPFSFARGGGGRPWKLVLGSGVPGRGGTLLVYHAPTLTSGAHHAGTRDSYTCGNECANEKQYGYP